MKGTYVYDAFGRRVKKVGNGVTQVFFYGPDGQMLEEVSPRRPLFTTDVARRYVHVDGELMGVVSQEVAVGTSAWTPVAWQALPPETRAPLAILLATLVSAGLLTLHPRARRAAAAVAVSGAALSLHSCTPAAAFAWVHTDILGTPLAVTDSPATGTAIRVVWRASYEPFGKATVAPNLDGDGNPANDFVLHVRFPGQYFDGESGYHYNYFRDYDPATGRYLEADPIGQNGGIHLYSYASGDAVNFTDPLGLWRNPWSLRQEAKAFAEASNLPGETGGQQDAYRHCVASCMVAAENSVAEAELYGWLNEKWGNLSYDQSAAQELMDYANNARGRARAAGLTDPNECPPACRVALECGELELSSDVGSPVYSDQDHTSAVVVRSLLRPPTAPFMAR